MTNTKKQSENLKKSLNAGNVPAQPLKLNLIHCIFIHGIVCELYLDSIDENFKNFILDIIALHENIIEPSDNDKLKTKMNYKSLNTLQNEKTTKSNGSKKPQKKLQTK